MPEPYRAGKYYHVDIWIGGRKFHRSTRQTSLRAARLAVRAIEAQLRTAATTATTGGDMTLDQVAGWFWQHHGARDRAAADTESKIGLIVETHGAATRMADLSEGVIASNLLRRRAQTVRKGGPRGKLISAATVNREVELLRRILRKARRPLELPPHLLDIEWGDLREREPAGRVRELSQEEERALFAALDQDTHHLIAHYIASGVRLTMAIGLRKTDLDLHGGSVRFTAKGGDPHILPISPAMRACYTAALKDNPTDFVFTYQAKRTAIGSDRMPVTVRGERYAWTREGVKSMWRRRRAAAALECPSLADFRLHDLRHTSGTRALRETGNLALVKRLLGHSDIRTTTRYAHVMDADLLDGMSRISTPTIRRTEITPKTTPAKRSKSL